MAQPEASRPGGTRYPNHHGLQNEQLPYKDFMPKLIYKTSLLWYYLDTKFNIGEIGYEHSQLP
jgi:hypothetical protein